MKRKVYLIASEIKDLHSIVAFKDNLFNEYLEPILIEDLSAEMQKGMDGLLGEIARDLHPIAIISSVYARDILSILRPRNTFTCVGVEHGIAPFKRYTYNQTLLASDFYLAPTKIWYDRLADLYPAKKSKLRLGGYPRLDVLREMRRNPPASHPAVHDGWLHCTQKNLVVFSWGINPKTIEGLPDVEGVIYLLHPADRALDLNGFFKKAQIFVSDPYLTPFLIATCNQVYGDFSSLTLEAISLEIPAKFILDDSLYNINTDLGDKFLDRNSNEYGKIPHSDIRIPNIYIINIGQMIELISCGQESESHVVLPKEIFPPDEDNRALTARNIADIVNNIELANESYYDVGNGICSTKLVQAIALSYGRILGRHADISGLRHFIELFVQSNLKIEEFVPQIQARLLNSSEKRQQLSNKRERNSHGR